MLYAIVGLLVIIADQWVKFWVANHISMSSVGEDFIPGILSLVNVHNDGAAFGFLSGSGARIPFIVLAGVFALVVILALATKLIAGKLARWSIVLVAAGGLSNCLDRVIYGYVQDMFKCEFINFPVFNVADIFITVFAIIFAIAVIFGKTRPDDDDEDEEFEDAEEELTAKAQTVAVGTSAAAASIAAKPASTVSQGAAASQRPKLTVHTTKVSELAMEIHVPSNYEQVARIADDLLANHAAIVNFERVAGNEQQRIFDFINGVSYVLNCAASRVSPNLMLYVPDGVDVATVAPKPVRH